MSVTDNRQELSLSRFWYVNVQIVKDSAIVLSIPVTSIAACWQLDTTQFPLKWRRQAKRAIKYIPNAKASMNRPSPI
jgi:hypothetical protein